MSTYRNKDFQNLQATTLASVKTFMRSMERYQSNNGLRYNIPGIVLKECLYQLVNDIEFAVYMKGSKDVLFINSLFKEPTKKKEVGHHEKVSR